MALIRSIVQIIDATLGSLAALMSMVLFLRLRWPAPVLWFVKLYVSALSSVLGSVGVLVTFAGLTMESVFITLIGLYVALIFFIHAFRVTRPPDPSGSFEKAFGLHWETRIEPELDLVLPGVSPSAHTEFYDVERFLALQVRSGHSGKAEEKKREAHP